MVKFTEILNKFNDHLKKNYFLIFQIYITLYIFKSVYFNYNLFVNDDILKTLEKVIIFNFFQFELGAFLLIYLSFTIKKDKKINELKIIYENYLNDMKKQSIGIFKANIFMLISLILIGITLYFLFREAHVLELISLTITLNKVILNKIEFLIPCSIYLISFVWSFKNNENLAFFNSMIKLKNIWGTFIMAIPFTILLFAIRSYITNDNETSMIASAILGINISILSIGIKIRFFSKNKL